MNNIVGKILILLQLVFSLCFMCFAGATYTYSAKWKAEAEKQTQLVTTQQAQLADKDRQHVQLLEKLNADLIEQTNRADEKAAEADNNSRVVVTTRAALAEAEKQRDINAENYAVANSEAEARKAESIQLRSEVQKQRDTIQSLIGQRRDIEDETLDLKGRVAAAKEREIQTLAEIGRLNDLLRYHELDPRQEIVGSGSTELVKVDGKVLATRKNESRSAELIHISVGSDDRIVVGMTMVVFRGSKYLGELRITDVYADSAVGLVVERTRNGVIERGDDVTTKL